MSALDSPSLHVSRATGWLGRLVGNYTDFWIKLGNLESQLLMLEETPVHAPVYICGLARSGSTVLLETLAAHPQAASHRYQDFPFLFTPYWWNKLLGLHPFRDKTLRERAHGDQVMITSESPEAMEEMLWMAFFPGLHDPARNQAFDASTANPGFERFYRVHIQKLLLVRKANRYVSKENYNITRMAYLQRIFPDARFIIPIRDPASHVESLMRQHERFKEAGRKDPRVPEHMSLAGHFEFGLNRSPIHIGNDVRIHEITQAWQTGDEVRGFALYWDMIYRFIHDQFKINPALSQASLTIPFEVLCAAPQETLRRIFAHSQLPEDSQFIESRAALIHAPDYYQSVLSPSEMEIIKSICGETARLYGYN